jgi:hypothetical protein
MDSVQNDATMPTNESQSLGGQHIVLPRGESLPLSPEQAEAPAPTDVGIEPAPYAHVPLCSAGTRPVCFRPPQPLRPRRILPDDDIP